MTEKTLLKPKRRQRVCRCGCGTKFTPLRASQVFADKNHRTGYWSELQTQAGGKMFRTYYANRELFAEFLKHRRQFEDWLNRRNARQKRDVK